MMLLLLLACSDKAAEETGALVDTGGDTAVDGDCVDAPAVTWQSWGEGFFTTWCQPCHSATTPERNGAPEGVDFDSEADLLYWSASVRRTVLEDGSMPVGGGLSADDAALLEALLDCGL